MPSGFKLATYLALHFKIFDYPLTLNKYLKTFLFLSVTGELSPKDSAVDCYCLLPMNNPQTTASMGTYTVKWRRAANAHSQILTSTVSFPPVAAKYQAYTMSAGNTIILKFNVH